MVDTTTIYVLVLSSVIQLGLTVGTVYYAYRITKLLGSFLAWTLIIIAFLLLTIRNVTSFVLTLLIPPQQLGSIISSIDPVTLAATQILNFASSILLLAGIYALFKTFQRQSKKP